MDEPVSFQVTPRENGSLELSGLERKTEVERSAYLEGIADAALQIAYAFDGALAISAHLRGRVAELRKAHCQACGKPFEAPVT